MKFYENINHDILKELLSRKFKDKDLLWILNELIDSFPIGLPLGNYPSQYLANFYLHNFDHWIKEKLRIKDYFRYMDDIVILGDDKEELWKIFHKIQSYLYTQLKLQIKSNYQVFPLNNRPIDFVGYKHFIDHTLLRKSIKQKMKSRLNNCKSYDSTRYYGWSKSANCRNLERKYKINPYENKKERIQEAI